MNKITKINIIKDNIEIMYKEEKIEDLKIKGNELQEVFNTLINSLNI